MKEKNTFQENYEQMKKHYEGEVDQMMTMIFITTSQKKWKLICEIPMQVRHYQQLAGRREDELGVLRGEVSLYFCSLYECF